MTNNICAGLLLLDVGLRIDRDGSGRAEGGWGGFRLPQSDGPLGDSPQEQHRAYRPYSTDCIISLMEWQTARWALHRNYAGIILRFIIKLRQNRFRQKVILGVKSKGKDIGQ